MSAANALAVMDTDARAVALLADTCVGLRQKQWQAHLAVHDEARAAVAELIEQQARTLELLEQAREKLELAHIREKAKWHKLYLSTAAQACAEHLPKVRAALARVGGGKP